MTRIHTVNPDFNREVIDRIGSGIGSQNQELSELIGLIIPIYDRYREEERIFSYIESDEDFRKRVKYEIAEAKSIIEQKLNKPVRYLCWPHGENNEEVHQFALSNGYQATSVGKSQADGERPDRFERFGVAFKKNFFFSRLLWRQKLGESIRSFPEYTIGRLYKKIRYAR